MSVVSAKPSSHLTRKIDRLELDEHAMSLPEKLERAPYTLARLANVQFR